MLVFEARDFEQYTFRGRQTDLIFAMKEFRAFLELCDGLNLDFQMHFTNGGDPIVFAAVVDECEGRLTMEMVVATVQNSERATQSPSMSQSTMATSSQPRLSQSTSTSQSGLSQSTMDASSQSRLSHDELQARDSTAMHRADSQAGRASPATKKTRREPGVDEFVECTPPEVAPFEEPGIDIGMTPSSLPNTKTFDVEDDLAMD
eukprot:COSAG05_NODE_41_length_26845_cov_26.599230_20_plen_204_part_00